MKKNESFLTVKDVSEKLNLSPSIVYTILNYDRLDCEKIGGRIIVKSEVFNEWVKRNKMLMLPHK